MWGKKRKRKNVLLIWRILVGLSNTVFKRLSLSCLLVGKMFLIQMYCMFVCKNMNLTPQKGQRHIK